MSLVTAKRALVLDWTGSVGHIVTKSPAYVKVDITYVGRTAHPAEWGKGKNAGAALIDATSRLKVGEYAPGVTCNVGIFEFGQARNQVPGTASLQAELRSYDTAAVAKASASVEKLFIDTARAHGVEPAVSVVKDSPSYELNQSGAFFESVTRALKAVGQKPILESTYGCFDGNVLSSRGLEVIMMGAGYYNPHSPSEYLNRHEFAEAFEFIKFVA
jgi:tripeptide aminopeptidase